jgi:hypothetical protein
MAVKWVEKLAVGMADPSAVLRVDQWGSRMVVQLVEMLVASLVATREVLSAGR